MSIYKRRIDNYKEKRERVLRGEINCIPFPLSRFRQDLPGIEQGKYYLLTGSEKSAKSQITDFLFMLSPLLYAYNNRDKISLKILYFSLEMAISEKFDQIVCFCLYYFSKGQIRIDSKQLNSLNDESPLAKEVLEILESKEYQDFFEFIEETVVFNQNSVNPFGIFKFCKEFAEARGKLYKKVIPWRNEVTGEPETKEVIDYFEKNNPNEYWIVITDHLSLLTKESGMDFRESIGKFSSKDCVQLRNNYGFTIVNIQQQSASKQDNTSFKLDRLTPSTDGLADNKMTAKDCNVMLGIFSPFKFEKANHLGYNIKDEWRDNIRFLEVCLNRNGSSGVVTPLYFDGACNAFFELPLPNDVSQLSKYKQMALKAQGKI